MRKIPTVFQRDFSKPGSPVIDEVTPGCEWVLDGTGEAERKIDGTCCAIINGKLYKRREVSGIEFDHLKAPVGFLLADRDMASNKVVGWVPVSDTDPADRWHCEAMGRLCAARAVSHAPDQSIDGTYELIGPKVQGNPEKVADHILWPHDRPFGDFGLTKERSFENLKAFLSSPAIDIEGIVFKHPDGVRMAKIKKRDFGVRR